MELLEPIHKTFVELRCGADFIERIVSAQIIPIEPISSDSLEVLSGLSNKELEELLENECEPFSSVDILVNKIKKSIGFEDEIHISSNDTFEQSISAYKQGMYALAIQGLTATLDRFRFKLSKNNAPRIKKRLESFQEEFSKAEDTKKVLSEELNYWMYNGFLKIVTSIWEGGSFNESEPDRLDRHWIMHGMSDKEVTKADCIKVIRLIYVAKLIDKAMKE